VVVSVETGAPEEVEKVPADGNDTPVRQECLTLLGSRKQNIQQYHMHEALDTASASDVDNNPDFKFYVSRRPFGVRQET